MPIHGRTAVRGIMAVLGALTAARTVASCGSANEATGALGADGGTGTAQDAGATPLADPPCEETSECVSNRICLYATPEALQGHCEIPTGSCTGPEDTLVRTGHCYPGARCDLTGAVGRCVFTPASRAAFPTSSVITLDSPTDSTALTARDGFTLQWEVLTAEASGSSSVAVIMDAPPARDASTNTLHNPANIRWIWSSSDPGGAVQEGAVPLRFGARGLTPTGMLSPTRWSQDTLPEGAYWWFVYVIARGEVVSASTVQHFRVGPDRNPGRACTTVDQCVALGDFPETAACVASKCERRCASDRDCPAVGSHCDFSVVVTGEERHSGYCGPILPPAGPVTDGGAPDAPI